MIAVGVSFMIMGSTYFIVTRLLRQEMPQLAQRIQKRIFFAGVCITILAIIALFIPSPYEIILPTLPVLILALSMRSMAKELFRDEQKPSQDSL